MLGLVEGFFVFIQRQHAQQPVAKNQRHTQPAMNTALAVFTIFEMWEANRDILHNIRLMGIDHAGAEVAGNDHKSEPDEFIQIGETAPPHNNYMLPIQLLNRATIIRYNLLQFREDEVKDFLQAEG